MELPNSQSPLRNSDSYVPPKSSQKLKKLHKDLQICQKRFKEIGQIRDAQLIGSYHDGSFVGVKQNASLLSNLYNRITVNSEEKSLGDLNKFIKKSIQTIDEFKKLAKEENLSEELVAKELDFARECNEAFIRLNILAEKESSEHSENSNFSVQLQKAIPLVQYILTELTIPKFIPENAPSLNEKGASSLVKKDDPQPEGAEAIRSLLRNEDVDNKFQEFEVPHGLNNVPSKVSIPSAFARDLLGIFKLRVNGQTIITKEANTEKKNEGISADQRGQRFYNLMQQLGVNEHTLQNICRFTHQGALVLPHTKVMQTAFEMDPNIENISDLNQLREWEFSKISDPLAGDKIIWSIVSFYSVLIRNENGEIDNENAPLIGLKTTVTIPLSELDVDIDTLPSEMIGKSAILTNSITSIVKTPQDALAAFQNLA